jgi:predicted nucleic acid-binding protein
MVLVDTSVWIRFLSGREPFASGLDELLSRDDVAGHELVFGELVGSNTKKSWSLFVRDDCRGVASAGST